jgi:hypothetical protein
VQYTLGAIENAKLLAEIYPGWVGRFYVSQVGVFALLTFALLTLARQPITKELTVSMSLTGCA